MREFYGAPNGGALVTGIQPDSPAAKSDLKEDDVIVSVDGQPVKDTWELQKAVADRAPGTSVKLGIIRGKKQDELTVKLGEMPAKYAGLEAEKKETPAGQTAVLGLRVSELSDELKKALKLPDARGVVVLGVSADSPAYGKLERGDVITRINNKEIRSLDDYESAIQEARKAKAKFLIIRFTRRSESGEPVSSVVDVPTQW
jgi:serine protease Do